MISDSTHPERSWLSKYLQSLLDRPCAQYLILALALCFSLPEHFDPPTTFGLDPSWQLAIQVAAIQDKVFGRDFIFTYGPLGYLSIHAPVNKATMLFYDFFVMGSLLAIYRCLLPRKVLLTDAFLVISLALVTKIALSEAPSTILFTILGFWLWMTFSKGKVLAIVAVIISAFFTVFTKLNYGIVTLALIPFYGVCLLLSGKIKQAFSLIVGFAVSLYLGVIFLHVDFANYLRSGLELISGYGEAMYLYPSMTFVGLHLAFFYLLLMVFTACLLWKAKNWKGQVVILIAVFGAFFLLYKNGFVRSDHYAMFFLALPLLLACWFLSSQRSADIKILLSCSILYPLAFIVSQTPSIGRIQLFIPVTYFKQAMNAPSRRTVHSLQVALQKKFPAANMPVRMLETVGKSSVDFMPHELSIAIFCGLNYKPRPTPQSYCAYTPWLDRRNADFLGSPSSPQYILYGGFNLTIDNRLGSWDESLTKKVLFENYTFESQFPFVLLKEAPSFPILLLKKLTRPRQLLLVKTWNVALNLGQTAEIPQSEGLLFLKVKIQNSGLGKIRALAMSASSLNVTLTYEDGSSATHRAISSILETGVMINRRIESMEEIENWLKGDLNKNLRVVAVKFDSPSPWAFDGPIQGIMEESNLGTR